MNNCVVSLKGFFLDTRQIAISSNTVSATRVTDNEGNNQLNIGVPVSSAAGRLE